jgi:hypothetical protein
MQHERNSTVRNSDFYNKYFSRYGKTVKRTFQKPKPTLEDIADKIAFMERDQIYKKLRETYHPFFADMMFAADMNILDMSNLLNVNRDRCSDILKDPILHITIYEVLRLADILFEDPDNILMNILQRDFKESKRRDVSFDKLVEDKIWRDVRVRKEKSWNIRKSHKQIIENMLKKMI